MQPAARGRGAQLDSSFSRAFAKASFTAGATVAPAPLAGHCELQRVLLWAEAEVHPAVKYLKCKKPGALGGRAKTQTTSEEMQAAQGWRKPWAESSLCAINKALESEEWDSSGEGRAARGSGRQEPTGPGSRSDCLSPGGDSPTEGQMAFPGPHLAAPLLSTGWVFRRTPALASHSAFPVCCPCVAGP